MGLQLSWGIFSLKNRTRKIQQFLIEDYLEHCHQLNRSKNTIDSYARDLIQFKQWSEIVLKKKFNKLGPRDIQSYLRFLKTGQCRYRKGLFNRKEVHYRLKKPLSIATQKRHLSSLKNFFDYLVQKYPKSAWYKPSFRMQFSESPIKSKLHQLKIKDGDFTPTPLVRTEHWEALMAAPLNLKERLFLSLLYWGGLRISEAKDLKVDQLDLSSNMLNLVRKGGKRHHYFIYDDGKLAIWWEAFAQKHGSDFLFPSSYLLGPITRRGAYKMVKRCFEKANLPEHLSPHGLRKACATRLYQQTKDLLFVRDYLNHSDAKVTQRYIEVNGPQSDAEYHQKIIEHTLGSGLSTPLQ